MRYEQFIIHLDNQNSIHYREFSAFIHLLLKNKFDDSIFFYFGVLVKNLLTKSKKDKTIYIGSVILNKKNVRRRVPISKG